MHKKKLIITLLITVTIFLVLASLYYFFPMTFAGNGYAEGSLSYSNGKITINFNSQNGNPRIDANNCYHLGLIDNCRGVTSGSSIMLQNIDEATCNSIGASWERQSSARGCDGKACYLGNIDLSDYVILSENISSPSLYFDLADFKTSKTLNICNNGNTNIASSSATIILTKDYDVTVFELNNSQCKPLTIKKSLSTNYFTSMSDCNSGIQRIEIYKLENNECIKYTILPTDVTQTDYTTLEDCTQHIKTSKPLIITLIVIFIIIIVAGGICIMAAKAKKKKKR
jgi:hypothetical protein